MLEDRVVQAINQGVESINTAVTTKETYMLQEAAECCSGCRKLQECGGCVKVNGHPFGGICVAAEIIKKDGLDAFIKAKKALIGEINELNLPGVVVNDMNLMNGCYLNLEYPLPNGTKVKLLDDKNVYWANQIQINGSNRCYGICADDNFIFVSKYSGFGENPELVLLKKKEQNRLK